MSKVLLIYHARHHEKVMAGLHERGIVELKRVENEELVRRVAGEELEKIRSYAKRLARVREFLREPPRGRLKISSESLDCVVERADRLLSRIEPQISKLQEESEGISREEKELSETSEKLVLLSKILPDADLRSLRSTEHVRVFFGRLPEAELEPFEEEVRRISSRAVIQSSKVGRAQAVLLIAPARDAQKLLPLFYRHSFELIDLPPLDGKVSEVLSRLSEELSKLEERKRKLEDGRKRLAERFSAEVFAVEEMVMNVLERKEADGLLGSTEATVVVEGWVPVEKIRELKRIAERATGGKYILREEESPDAPTEFENPRIVRDFEFLTAMYGVPRYSEPDPTPFLFLTFPLFFAVAFSDAGYGVALAAFLLSGVWIAKIFPENVRRTLIVCSIVSIFIGALIGGWFGFGSGIWMNPIENPIPLLKLVVLIGVLHILLGIGVAGGMKDLMRRDWRSFIFERISKVLIVAGFFGLAFSVIGVSFRDLGIPYTFPRVGMFEAFSPLAESPHPVGIFRIVFYSGVVLGVAGALLKSGSAGAKIGGALNALYGITGFVADAASYTRLMALGIASGVIAFTINFVVSVFWGWMVEPFAGGFPRILVAGMSACVLALLFFAAHCFNIFINALGGFIHTMRLHFLEFFGKFYDGDGRRFSPFRARRNYTRLK